MTTGIQNIMQIFFYFLLVVTVLLGITFAALNAEPVTLHYYIGVKQLPLSFLLVFSLVFGVLLGWALSFTMFLRARREIFMLKYKLKHMADTLGSDSEEKNEKTDVIL